VTSGRDDGEILRGLGVSPGIAIGRALVLEGPSLSVSRLEIAPQAVRAELTRFEHAARVAMRQLRLLRGRVRREAGEAYARIFHAQMLILKDPALRKDTAAMIRRERVNAEFALRTVLGRYGRLFAGLGEPDLRERGTDIEDVENRVQMILAGITRRRDLGDLARGAIVVSAALSPSDAASLSRARVAGLAIDGGGPTSHATIIASALGLPAVAGLRTASSRLRTGDLLVLDGAEGLVVRNPSPSELQRWHDQRARLLQRDRNLEVLRDRPAATSDGVGILLMANIELPEETAAALRYGAEGIGLYRSEFLYLREAPELPDEEQLHRAYRDLAAAMLPHEVVIRTLDLGGEKFFAGVPGIHEPNPVLGLRAIRLCLGRPELFRAQLRAALRAALHGKVRLLLPMVSGVEEIREARARIDAVRREMERDGVPCQSEVPLGVMIEVPAAALCADRLAAEVDFFAIGTNDLIQYTLAIDRNNESVSYLYRPLHPAILMLVRRVVEAASARGLRVSVCGEMAADPFAAVVLIGLGITELSMNPAAIPGVKQMIRSIAARDARAIVDEALALDTAAAIEETVRRRVLALLPSEQACPL
jgi:phosphotransferase system enzyme I (PtsI)